MTSAEDALFKRLSDDWTLVMSPFDPFDYVAEAGLALPAVADGVRADVRVVAPRRARRKSLHAMPPAGASTTGYDKRTDKI